MEVYGTEETFDKFTYKNDVNITPIKAGKPVKIEEAGFTFIAFDVRHDAAKPVNYVFKNAIGEYGIYITDSGQIKLKLPNVRPKFILIEANFDKEVLKALIEESRKIVVRDRGYESTFQNRQLDGKFGHLSVQDTIDVLKTMQLGMCEQITLCHLSPSKNYTYFAEMVSKALDNKIPVKQLPQFETEITIIENKKEGIQMDF